MSILSGRAAVAFSLALFSLTSFAQDRAVFEERPAVLLSSDTLELTVLPEGGAMAQLVLTKDKDKISPLWNPYRIAREAGLKPPAALYRGHFICVDGFGPASDEERAAGLPMHGEAYMLPWHLDALQREGGSSATFSVTLPLAQERLTRTYRVLNGENVVWVDTELENLMAFDRPVFWGEHATVSAPFLEPGKVLVDMPAVKAKTKAYEDGPATASRRLRTFTDFTWPSAPTRQGGQFDLRSAPMADGTTDHVASLLDPSRRLVFATALHRERGLVIGWVFRREEFPWVQTWLSYPGPNRMARGLEFATQPFDLPRAEVLRSGPLFDTPVFRILPAKSKISASFLMFYARVPEGFAKVEDVRLESGKLLIEDRTNGKQLMLTASRSL